VRGVTGEMEGVMELAEGVRRGRRVLI
jgi:hypothetical protein